MLYTHNWGLFLSLGSRARWCRAGTCPRSGASFWRDALLGFGVAGVLYLPWLPTLLHQLQHTGAPWLNPPNFGAPIQITRSLLGGGTPDRRAGARGRLGLAVIARRVEDKERTAVLAGAVTVLATLAVAWLVSQVSPAWTTRYLGVLLGPMLLIAALGLARAARSAWSRSRSSWRSGRSRGPTGSTTSRTPPTCATPPSPSCTRTTSSCRCSPSRARCSPTTSRTSAGRPSCASRARWGR